MPETGEAIMFARVANKGPDRCFVSVFQPKRQNPEGKLFYERMDLKSFFGDAQTASNIIFRSASSRWNRVALEFLVEIPPKTGKSMFTN